MPNPQAGYTPPHGAHAPRAMAAPPPSAPTYPPQNAWAQSRTYNPLRRAPESAPAWASSPPNPAVGYSSLRSASAARAHRSRPPPALQLLPTPQSSQSAPSSAKDHSQNVRIADQRTTAASSSSPPHPPFSAPRAASARKSPAASARLLHSGGNSGIYS